MENTVLEVKNLYKSFIGVKALKNVELSLKKGEIHCLAGENGCGKSTLVKCVSGVYTPDSGKIFINGQEFSSLTPQLAMKEGIQVIYQDLSLFRHMSIAENIAIGKLRFDNTRIINWKKVYQIAKEQLDKIGVDIDLSAQAGEVSMANRQITAICRALAQDAKILFMDEPTTALTKNEVQRLMKIMLNLKSQGLSIVFISHKLDEVLDVSDNITIFRNGEKVGDFTRKELDEKKLAYFMTGREVEYPKYVRRVHDDHVLLSLKNMTRKDQYHKISFDIRPGDIVGLTGLLGSGRTELAMSLFGLNPYQEGEIIFEGKKENISSPSKAKEIGIALLPEDRFTQGLFMERKIKENISSAMVDEISDRNILNLKKEKEIANSCIKEFNIKTPSAETIVGTLSGGNQQKVVIGKWSATHPKLFIMDTPTVGIDVGSKADIYEQIHKFADKGMAILFISDEIQEIMANCNKVVILSSGECIAQLNEEDLARKDAGKMLADLIGSQMKAGNGSEAV